MTIDEARNAIYAHFHGIWTGDPVSASVPLVFDDTAGDSPGLDADGRPHSWARVTVLHTSGAEETLGGIGVGRDVAEGFITVQVFTPRGHGYTLSDALVKVAQRAFRRQRFSEGWFSDVSSVETPTMGLWAQMNVSARFRYSELVT
jgi:voltage-gated potassium channel Kch